MATFPTAEHWMMSQKALLFEDSEIAKQVLAITGSGHADCGKVKAMGRNVQGFEEEVWVNNRGAYGILLLNSSPKCLITETNTGFQQNV
jgi:predicted NAD-dependent protein-ADP-ribosyltransferase YbiA (DUF1768 family)